MHGLVVRAHIGLTYLTKARNNSPDDITKQIIVVPLIAK